MGPKRQRSTADYSLLYYVISNRKAGFAAPVADDAGFGLELSRLSDQLCFPLDGARFRMPNVSGNGRKRTTKVPGLKKTRDCEIRSYFFNSYMAEENGKVITSGDWHPLALAQT